MAFSRPLAPATLSEFVQNRALHKPRDEQVTACILHVHGFMGPANVIIPKVTPPARYPYRSQLKLRGRWQLPCRCNTPSDAG